MHRVVPDLILENYRLGRYSGEFPAVALFLDLSGFSSMTDVLMQQGQHGAEVLAGLMHSVFDPLVESIFAHSGKIVSFAGDGIMALFQIETDERFTALTALAAAWEIQQRLAENPERQTVYGKFQFSVKIGLAVGSVAWGILRSEDNQNATYYFRGSAVDDSAEAEHHALAGEILITDGINTLLQDAIKTEPIDSYYKFGGFCIEMPVATPTLFKPIDLEVARIFMPEKIIVQDVRGEFRQIVNLFMRFPDLPNDKLHEFFYVVFELHKKYGGLLNRLDFGDKGCNMLMLWGAPVAYENDIGRAINFILDLQARVDFSITAGITYYIAHAGYLGSKMCEDYTCYGWGINLASRFMMSAPPGQVWIDDRIARRIGARFDIEFIGEQRFKGFSTEQRVNLLKGKRSETELTYQGELIGRETELALLEKFIEPLWSGNFAGMLLVEGEAGMGKGRLVHEFRASELFEKNRTLWAVCQSDQILRQPFNPLRSWLFRYFGFSSIDNVEDRKIIFNAKLQELISVVPDPSLFQELDRLHSVLGALVDLRWADSHYEQLNAEGRYNNTLLALIALVKAESLRRPLILFIEDMQFIDDDTLNFLSRLKRALRAGPETYPVAIIATSRPYGSKQPPEGLIESIVELKGLTLDGVARLTEILLGGVPDVELVKLFMDRSEGNPYFVMQIIRYMQEGNFIEMSERGWKQVKRTRDFFVPSDISSLLVARLDQLTPEVKDIVQTASILGREFALPVLARMAGEAEHVKSVVVDAQQSEIWVALDDHRYVFTHGLLRDAAYSMQMRARRMELHALAVSTLESIYENELHLHYAQLAHHAERAQLMDKAVHYLRQAGKVAADAYQNNQAVDFYTRALAFVAPDDLPSQYDLLAERVELYYRMGKRDLQWKDLTALERWAKDLSDMDRIAKTLMLQASYYFATGDYLNSIDCAKRAESYSTSAQVEHTELALYTQVVWCMALLRLGRLDEAMHRAWATLYRDRSVGNRKEECRILTAMGLIALEQKEPAQATKYLVDAVEIAREIKDPGLEARALNNLALSEASVNGNYALALQYYKQSYKIAIEIGDRTAESLALGNLGFIAGMQGDFVAARSYHEQSLYLAREIGNRYQETYTLINLGAVAGFQADSQLALQYAQQALELSQKISERAGEAWAMLYMGHAYLLENQLEQAQAAYRKSIDIRDELGQPSLSMEPIAGLVETYLQAGAFDSASEEAEKILNFLASGAALDGTDEPLRVYYVCYLLLKKKHDPRAQQILKTAIKLLEERVSKFSDEITRRQYIENIPWRRALQAAAQTELT